MSKMTRYVFHTRYVALENISHERKEKSDSTAGVAAESLCSYTFSCCENKIFQKKILTNEKGGDILKSKKVKVKF